ncbi:MAG TPA: hypothetical protein DCF68_12875 [Cyanothece sp. UBA12306]|nr:hypothetical protein [Cyanothece sp. UBA12306]
MTRQFWILDLQFWIKNKPEVFQAGENLKSSNRIIINLKSKIRKPLPRNRGTIQNLKSKI